MGAPLTREQQTWLKHLGTLIGAKGSVVAAGAEAVQPASSGSPASAPGKTAAPDLAGPLPVAVDAPMPSVEMKDEDIAAGIMDKQVAILAGWKTALQVFDKTMTSSADAEATPDFQKVVVGYFADKLMGAIVKHAPGASELDALVKALDGEFQRASTAGASATLRDFVVQHAKALGKLEQATWAQRQGFISAVRARREAIEAPVPVVPERTGKKGGVVVSSKEADAYGMMRMALLDTIDQVEKVLSGSSPEALFKVLSEEWIRHATVRGGMSTRFQAVVVIRLNPDYSILDAHIQGSGGQKLAEQLLKDSPGGVDVFRLVAPRRILLMADNGWPSVILSLDANNRDISTGSYAEGDTGSLRKYVMGKGLPLTTKLAGD